MPYVPPPFAPLRYTLMAHSATGWFGQAFTENVMESLAFDFDESTGW